MKNLVSRSQTHSKKYLFKHSPERKEVILSVSREAEKSKLCEVINTQRYLLELDTIARLSPLGKMKKSQEKSGAHMMSIEKKRGMKKLSSKELAKMIKDQKVEGFGIQEARMLSVEEQFKLAKESLDDRQRHLEKLYLGKKGSKAFFEVFEKHVGRMFDTRTGAIGAVGWLLGRVGLSYNRSLEKKMEKQCGIAPENFRKLYGEMQTQLEKNKLQFEKMEHEEAKRLGKTVKEFRKSGEYSTFFADMAMVGLSLGMNALGLSTGVFVPLMHVSLKRKAFAMDANAALKYMNEGMSYTDAVKRVSEETDKAVFMAHNLMRNANVLIAGPDGKNLAHVDKRWENFQAMKSHLTFDKNKYNVGDIAEKNLYESMGFVIDSQGLIHFKEAKKFKNILYGFGERMFGDRKEKRSYKNALRTLKKKPKKGRLSEQEIIKLNQEKVYAVETILDLMKQENAEDFLRRYARKDKAYTNEFKDSQMFGKVITNEHRLKKKYLKRPEKMEGRIAAVRQMERFVDSQRVLVRNQRELYAVKSLSSSHKNEALKKTDILYKAAILGMLESFDSARDLTKNFPIVPQMELRNGECILPASEHARQTKIMTLLHEFYRAKNSQKVEEGVVIDAMASDPDFRKWVKDIGEWSALQKNDPCGYERMSCMQKIQIDTARIKNKAEKNKGSYEFNSVAAIAPYRGAKIPLGVSTAWFGGNFNIGRAVRPGRIETITSTETQTISQTIKDPISGLDIVTPIDVPIEVSAEVVSDPTFIDTAIAHGGAQALAAMVGPLISSKTKAEKRLKKDAKSRYKDRKPKR